MKKSLSILVLLFSCLVFSQETKVLTIEDLKLELKNFLIEKGQIINSENSNATLWGIHKRKIGVDLQNGIYGFGRGGSHRLVFFVIVEDNSYDILDISTIKGLKESIHKVLNFSEKQEFCEEIINDYLSRLIHVHYNINRNPRRRLNKKCKKALKPTESSFTLNSLTHKLAEFLVNKNEMESIESFFQEKEYILIDRTDIYYGMPKEDEIVDCGIYTFINIDNDNPKLYYVIVNEDWLKILNIEKINLSETISEIIDFGERQNYCHLKTKDIIKQIIMRIYTDSCLDNAVFDLP